MEALGSPSISRVPMGGAMLSEYRKLVYADDRYRFAYLCRSFFLRISLEKSVKSMCYLKLYIKVYLMDKTKYA